MSKKIISAALAASTVVWAMGFAMLPLANAQTTTASLQAQIASLLAEIQALQAQLGTSSSATASTSYDFTTDLTVGSTGAQVKNLQAFLIAKGDLTAISAPTGYFGALTQAALAKFQAANSITPSVGYFGPKTRAFINALSVSTTTTTTTGTTTGTTPSGTPLSVAIDSQNPGVENLAAGAVNTPVLKLDFTAGATPVTVTNLILTRSGLSQDADLNNVYLYNGATKLASNLGFNNGAITFSNGAGLFTVPANSTMVITVSVDISTSASSGHIFQIGLTSASNITATGATFSGNFPLNSNQFTIASVSNLATLTVSGSSSSTVSVNAGQTGYLVGQFNVQAGNQAVKVSRLTFTNVGSVQSNYLQNIKLMNGATQLGATIASLGSDNTATFDLTNAPLMLTSGQTAVLSLYADVTGGVNRTFQFSIQQSSDVQAEDLTYGVGIGATAQSPLTFPIDFYNATINNGGLVVSRDAATPTTNVVAGNTNQVLAKFDVLASGDSIKFNELEFTTTGNNAINNFRVVDDQGAQIGTTVNLAAGSSTVTEGSGSLNYIIPANTTRILTVYGDLPSTASGTLSITFGGGSNSSAQSYTTYTTVTVPSVGANTLTVLASGTNLTGSLNYSLGSPVQAATGQTGVEIGSFTLTAGQVNAVNITGLTLLTATNATTVPYLSNLKVLTGTTQVGQTQPGAAASNQSYTFNTSAPIAVAANGSVTFNVYADISSNATATTTNGMVSLTAVNASTQTGNAVTLPATVTGQNVQFSTGGTLTGTISAGTSQASFLGMGVTGVSVAQYQFKADTYGNDTLTQLTLVDGSSSATSTNPATDHSTFTNYRLTDTAGNVLSTATENASGTLTFNLSGLSVSANTTQYVNLLADVNSYPYASSSAAHAYALTSYNYTNASTATTTAVTSNNIGNLFTVYRNTLNVTGPSFSAPNSISGVGNTVGEFNFTVGGDTNNPIIKTIVLTTNGTLIQASTTQVLGLYDASAPSTLLATSTATSTNNFTFTMNSNGANNWTLPSGGTRTLLVKTYSAPSNFVAVTAGTGNYQVLLQSGLVWTDGATASITGLSPSIAIPVASQNITNLSN